MEVDSEITFQLNRLRESMSSEDQIDTSDELINDVNVDDISGHQHDVNPNDHQEPQVSVWQKCQDVVKEAEAGKARMFATPGKQENNPIRGCSYGS